MAKKKKNRSPERMGYIVTLLLLSNEIRNMRKAARAPYDEQVAWYRRENARCLMRPKESGEDEKQPPKNAVARLIRIRNRMSKTLMARIEKRARHKRWVQNAILGAFGTAALFVFGHVMYRLGQMSMHPERPIEIRQKHTISSPVRDLLPKGP